MIHLCAIAKNEEPYLRDWCEYHRNKGFDCIHLFDNGGNGDLREISKFVNIYNAIGKQAIQLPAYQQIIDWMDKDDYCLFIDVDEFLTLDVGSIDKFISLVPNDVDCVLFNWKCYGDNGLDDYEEKPVWERFKEPAPKECIYNDSLPQGITENCHVKALVRKTNKQIIWNNVHTPLINNGKYVNANLEQVNPSPWQKINWDGGYLNHYLTKSKSEFIKRRLNKDKDATRRSHP